MTSKLPPLRRPIVEPIIIIPRPITADLRIQLATRSASKSHAHGFRFGSSSSSVFTKRTERTSRIPTIYEILANFPTVGRVNRMCVCVKVVNMRSSRTASRVVNDHDGTKPDISIGAASMQPDQRQHRRGVLNFHDRYGLIVGSRRAASAGTRAGREAL